MFKVSFKKKKKKKLILERNRKVKGKTLRITKIQISCSIGKVFREDFQKINELGGLALAA